MKLRIRIDLDKSSSTINRYYIEYKIQLTGTWIIQTPRTFSSRVEAQEYIRSLS